MVILYTVDLFLLQYIHIYLSFFDGIKDSPLYTIGMLIEIHVS